MITFVALLMFLQLGIGWEWSTLLCALLSLPWVLKSFVREKVRRMGRFSIVLRFIEACIFASLVALAFTFSTSTRWRVGLIFLALLVLCVFCAWHELAARMYYERMLRSHEQRIYNTPKMFFSQASVIVTYGAMIMIVGALEVFYHNRRNAIALSWSTAIYLLAGVSLLLFIYHIFVLRPPVVGNRHLAESFRSAVRAEVDVIDRILHKEHWLAAIVCLFLFMLPQSLLFYTRVLFLYAPHTDGGLGCSLQWIGLAQGTVGVIAFSAALGLGYWIDRQQRYRHFDKVAAALMGLSPLVYYAMTLWPPANLGILCLATFIAQAAFGFGLNACIPFVRYISGERYRSTINYLYIPLVSMVMLPATAASGWMVYRMGFHLFFALDALLLLPSILAAYYGTHLAASSQQSTPSSPNHATNENEK